MRYIDIFLILVYLFLYKHTTLAQGSGSREGYATMAGKKDTVVTVELPRDMCVREIERKLKQAAPRSVFTVEGRERRVIVTENQHGPFYKVFSAAAQGMMVEIAETILPTSAAKHLLGV